MKKQIILVAFFGFIIFGFGFTNFAQATSNPIPGVDIVMKPGLGGLMASSDLGVDNVGTLPTSNFYFFKQWGRDITRFFTFDSVAKAQLELNITNQIAAEVLEVGKANPDDAGALKKALENFTNAQERLNMRIGKLPTISNPNVEKLLKEVDEKTAKHVELLEQIADDVVTVDGDGAVTVHAIDNALNNTLKTFAFTVGDFTGPTRTLNMKQKAEEQIELAGVAIEEANDALAQVSTTRGMVLQSTDDEIDLPGAPISTSRSNIKHPSITATADSDSDEANSAMGEVSTTRGIWRPSTDDEVDLPGASINTTRSNIKRPGIVDQDNSGNSGDTGDAGIFDRWGNSIAKAEGNLESAKKAFADGKYGEAYGQARSAEAMVAGIGTVLNDDAQPSSKATAPTGATTQEPDETFSTKTKQPTKVETPETETLNSTSDSASSENAGQAVSPQATPEKTETTQPSGAGAGPTSNYDR